LESIWDIAGRGKVF